MFNYTLDIIIKESTILGVVKSSTMRNFLLTVSTNEKVYSNVMIAC